MQVHARFRPHPRGFGFLEPVDTDGLTPVTVTLRRDDGTSVEADRAFVPPPDARGLIADDLVTAELAPDDKGTTASGVEVVSRPRRMLVGTVTHGPGRLVLDPDPAIGSGWVRLADPVAGELRAAVGRVVVVLRGEHTDGSPCGTALVAGPFIAGSPQAIRAITAVVALGRAAPDLVPGGAQAAGLDPVTAATTHTRLVGMIASGRRGAAHDLDTDGPVPGATLDTVDLRDEACVTIDDASAQDLDDAVTARWDGGEEDPVEVGVHIADAAGRVGIDSPADVYARTVAATAYLAVGANAPMLDPVLAEGALSLLPGQDRDVLSVRFHVLPDGGIREVHVEAARIVSDARLSYRAVDRWLDDDPGAVLDELDAQPSPAGPADPGAVTALLDALLEAARRLGVERDRRITFEKLFASAEVVPALVDGRLTVVDAEPHARAYRLVERLMVAANEAIASRLVATQVPALYRVHSGIDPERADRLRAAVELAGARVPGLDAHTSGEQVDAELLAEIDRLDTEGRDADRDLLVAVATGSTARAVYDPDPAHHRGLASGAYTHFTSPIRRYADLVVHRQLRASLAGEPPPYDARQLAALAVWLDARSGAVGHLEARERGDLWARLLERGHLDGVEPATVTGITPNGLRIRLPRLGLGGFVTAERALGLPDRERGRLEVDEHGLDTASGPWRVGSRVGVRFTGLDGTGRPNWRLGDLPG